MNQVLIPIFGGLGNQMFQVAHGMFLARRYRLDARFVDFTLLVGRVPRRWELNCFNIARHELGFAQKELLRFRILISRQLKRYSLKLHLGVLFEDSTFQRYNFSASHSVCVGYWQGEGFFFGEERFVRKLFRFPEIDAHSAAASFVKGFPSVAVHVRRGDYMTDPAAHSHHFTCDLDWYLRAMDDMRQRIANARFLIFSDDPDWASFAFQSVKDAKVLPRNPNAPAWVDMANMSRCDHFIISNSSYSWWASYLRKNINATIIAPKYWYPGVLTEDQSVLCKDWVLLG